MRKIGYFLHRSITGRYVVKITNSDKPPRLGSKVYNSEGRLLGVLVDLIGPVKNPYALIKPFTTVEVRQFEDVYVRW
ncbi:MAG: Gar1/Naf1 family protein [Desulfurococcaceae archaeon]|nr:Gar1/Naf1 family protein [Desulfurococcaceae archaeon]